MKSYYWLAALCCLAAAPMAAHGQDGEGTQQVQQVLVLTLDDAQMRARSGSPVDRLGGARLEEVEGRRADADLVVRDNAVLSGDFGPRIQSGPSVSPKGSVGLEFFFDMGGGSTARNQGVDASLGRVRSETDEEKREVVYEVSVAWLRALWAKERGDLAGELEVSSESLLSYATKQLEAGQISALIRNAAQADLGRDRSTKQSIAAENLRAIGELRRLLGIDASVAVTVTGDLTERKTFDLAALLRGGATRPELAILDREVDEGAADIDLADSLAWPKLGIGARFEQEEDGIQSVLGTLSLTLPFFDRGQGLRNQGSAKVARARTEKAILEASIPTEIRTLYDVYQQRVAAVDALEAGGVNDFEANLKLGQTGLAAGEISILEVIVMRRALTDARSLYLDALLELGIARFDLERAASGGGM